MKLVATASLAVALLATGCVTAVPAEPSPSPELVALPDAGRDAVRDAGGMEAVVVRSEPTPEPARLFTALVDPETPSPRPVATVRNAPTPTAAPAQTAEPTPSPTLAPTPTATATTRATATPTPRPTQTVSAPEPTAAPAITVVPSASPTAAPTPAPTASATTQPVTTASPTPAVTATPSANPAASPTATPSPRPTPTPTPTPDQPPVVAQVRDIVGAKPIQRFSITVSASDPDKDPIRLSCAGGDKFTDNGNGTGTIDWIVPDSAKSGEVFTFACSATDGQLTSPTMTFTITIG